MFPTISPLASRARLARSLALLVAGLLPALASTQPANGPGDVFRRFSADTSVTREIRLADLGFAGPLVLGAPETRREVYLPVPANVAITGAQIKLDANYLRADGGRTTLLLSLDGYPVSSRAFALEKGDAGIVLGVDGAPRPAGFVRLGLDWVTALGAERPCTDARTPGNVLRIEPDTRFSYRYDGTSIVDLTTAWGALPSVPVILVASNNLGIESYDTAWRLGLALERAGKRSRVMALPALGNVVEIEATSIPSGLRAIPAFASLAQGGKVLLKDQAEIGALIALGQRGPLRADILIADKAMAAALATALDALAQQVQSSAPDAATAFAQWRADALDPLAKPLASRGIRVSPAFGAPAILVASDAGMQAAGLFGTYWNNVAASPSMVVQAADEPAPDAKAVSLKYLGGRPGSFDVLSHADWNANFDIGAVAANGRVPGTLVLDVSAAPSAARTPPIVSVFLNDILLGAKQLDADGKPERISAAIPGYALASRNVLRVSFVRQLASDRCRETPEAYPVSVLPSSHMLLETATPSDDFTGMVSRYAKGAHVMVPAAYLADAAATLPRVIRLAATTGVSPMNARFTSVTGEVTPAPGGAFLAVDLPMKDAKSHVKLDGGRVLIASRGDKPIFDATGLDHVGILEVVKLGSDTGVMYRTAGKGQPAMDKAILLARGDVAVLGPNGLLSEVDTADPGGRALANGGNEPWLLSWGLWWIVPIVAIVAMILLLVVASRMRRRKMTQTEPR